MTGEQGDSYFRFISLLETRVIIKRRGRDKCGIEKGEESPVILGLNGSIRMNS